MIDKYVIIINVINMHCCVYTRPLSWYLNAVISRGEHLFGRPNINYYFLILRITYVIIILKL